MTDEIARWQDEVEHAKRRLAEARAGLRRAKGRELARRNAAGESIDSLAKAHNCTRQYVHKLMSEAQSER